MAAVGVFSGAKILIKVGDGGDPESFAHPCIINTSRSVQASATTVDSVVPDCADPEAPAWTQREKDALSYTISGEGLCHASDVEDYLDWLESASAKNIQFIIASGETGEVSKTGSFHLTEFQVSGERKEKAQASITLVSTGAITDVA